MKLTITLMLLAVLAATAGSTYSQTTRINLKMQDASLVDVFREIERTSEFGFFFKNEEMDLNRRVSIDLKNATIGEILEKILVDNYDYRILDKNIVVTRSFLNNPEQQQKSVSGKVTESSGTPLPGVTVLVKGTTNGTITDSGGNYSLYNISGNAVLQFSFVGMKTQEIVFSGKTTINVVMEDETIGIDEVVAIGYGTVKKSDLTGAVNKVGSARLMDKPVLNLGQALQGKVAGVQVIQMGGGVPGGNPMIRIRGSNSISTNNDPLFVVDGIVGVGNVLMNLNPDDIVSTDILKDASATAIYGARGANGVILITTKRGLSGKTQIDYKGSVSVGVMQRHLYSMNAEQLMYTYEQAMANAEKYGTPNRNKDFRGPTAAGQSYSEMPWLFEKATSGYPVKLLGKDGNLYQPRYDNNWESIIFKPAVSKNHYIDIRGGNDNAKYSVSIGYTDQQGLMKDSYFKRYSTNLTGDVKVLKWLSLSTQLGFIMSKLTDDGGITRSTAEVWPIVPIQYPNDPDVFGIYASRWGTNADFNVGEQWYNIIFRRNQTFGLTSRNQVTGSLALKAQITKDLSFKSDFSIDFNNYKNNYYNGKYYGGDGSASMQHNNGFYWQNQNYFNYDKTFGSDHTLNAMIGISWSKYAYENLNAGNSVFFTNFYAYHNLGAGAAARPTVGSSDGSSALASYFARANYSYKGKYMATVTGRMDGSSKFGENSKFGFFPSAALAWRASSEDFLKNISTISNLKVRTSVGRTGNQEIGSYVTQRYVGVNSAIAMGGKSLTGIYPSSVGNPDLKWETTTQYDAGIDLGILKDRIMVSVDYYHKLTTDMLLSVPLPLSTTVGSVTMNYGSVQNQGFEVELNTRNVASPNIKWNTTISVSNNQNKITALGPTGAPIFVQLGAGNATTIYKIGYPIGSFFGLNRLGTWGTQEASEAARYGMRPGDLKFYDKDNDGKISLQSDGDIIGNAFPKFIIGFNNTFNYKNFDASIDIQIVQGVNKAFIHESAEDRQLVSGGLNSTLQAWRPDNQNTQIAQMRPGNGGAYYQSYADTHMLSDASFIRGGNLTVGYTLPDLLTKKINLERVRVYCSAVNFFLITKVEGYDPEGSSLDKSFATAPNSDKYQYPNPSTYSFGVNVSF
ncbi:MAG: TonB-dependent receptor [Bacteroidota bacterium]|nr:TonB-dependent receptor [Bacteroidota bacterium]